MNVLPQNALSGNAPVEDVAAQRTTDLLHQYKQSALELQTGSSALESVRLALDIARQHLDRAMNPETQGPNYAENYSQSLRAVQAVHADYHNKRLALKDCRARRDQLEADCRERGLWVADGSEQSPHIRKAFEHLKKHQCSFKYRYTDEIYRYTDDQEISDLFVLTPQSKSLLLENPHVLFVDSTRETYLFGLFQMLSFIGVAADGSPFLAATCLIRPTQGTYNWVFQQLRDQMTDEYMREFSCKAHEVPESAFPRTIFTHREQALHDAVNLVFPMTAWMVCVWHFKKVVKENWADRLQSRPKRSGIPANEAWCREKHVYDILPLLMNVTTKEEFIDTLLLLKNNMGKEYRPFLEYLHTEWWPELAGWAGHLTRANFTLDAETTQRVERSRWKFKTFLPTFDSIHRWAENVTKYCDETFSEIMGVWRDERQHGLSSTRFCAIPSKREVNGIDYERLYKMFSHLHGVISMYALQKTVESIETCRVLPERTNCECPFATQRGYPCIHTLLQVYHGLRPGLTTEDFDEQWHCPQDPDMLLQSAKDPCIKPPSTNKRKGAKPRKQTETVYWKRRCDMEARLRREQEFRRNGPVRANGFAHAPRAVSRPSPYQRVPPINLQPQHALTQQQPYMVVNIHSHFYGSRFHGQPPPPMGVPMATQRLPTYDSGAPDMGFGHEENPVTSSYVTSYVRPLPAQPGQLLPHEQPSFYSDPLGCISRFISS